MAQTNYQIILDILTKFSGNIKGQAAGFKKAIEQGVITPQKLVLNSAKNMAKGILSSASSSQGSAKTLASSIQKRYTAQQKAVDEYVKNVELGQKSIIKSQANAAKIIENKQRQQSKTLASSIQERYKIQQNGIKSVLSSQNKAIAYSRKEEKAQNDAMAAAIQLRAQTNNLSNKQSALNSIMSATGGTAQQATSVIREFGGTFNKQGQIVDSFGNSLDILGSQKFNTMQQAAKALRVPIDQVTNMFKRSNMIIQQNGQILDIATGKYVKFGKSISKVQKGFRRFNMNLLSILFGFGAIARVLGGFLKSAMTTYDKVNKESGAFYKETNKLRAAWEFLKYSIINALSQSELFKSMVNWLFIIINKLNEFMSMNPNAAGWIAIGLAIAFIGATALSAAASMGLLLGGLGGFGITLSSIGTLATSVFAALTSPIGLVIATTLILIMLIPKARKAFFEIFGFLFKALSSFGKMLIAVFKGDWELAKLYGVKVLIDLLNATSKFAETVIQLFIGIGRWIINAFIRPIMFALRLIDKIKGTNYAGALESQIDKIQGALSGGVTGLFSGVDNNLGNMIQSKIDAIIAERQANTGVEIGNVNIDINAQGQDLNERSAQEFADSIMNQLTDSINKKMGSTNT